MYDKKFGQVHWRLPPIIFLLFLISCFVLRASMTLPYTILHLRKLAANDHVKRGDADVLWWTEGYPVQCNQSRRAKGRAF